MRAAPGRPRWKGRLARALGLDGNPLRRASDRAEAWIRAGLLVILLTAGPMAAPALNFGKGAASVLATVLTMFALALLLLLEGPKIWSGVLDSLPPARARRWSRMAREINQSVTGYATSLGDWVGGLFGGFVAALLSIPCAAALQVIGREIWRTTAPDSRLPPTNRLMNCARKR